MSITTGFEPHSVGVDLRVPAEEALVRDDPLGYFYTVRLIEESDHDSSGGDDPAHNDTKAEKWSGSEMEVKANTLRYYNHTDPCKGPASNIFATAVTGSLSASRYSGAL